MNPSSRRLAIRVTELIEQRLPFVQATVVRAQCPTSARPGDAAVVLADGSIEGFVGGQCAEGSVRTAALDVLESREAMLLRILPEGDDDFPGGDGALTVVNPCLSGGALEIYLEPKLPAPRLVIIGQTPIASALADFGSPLGFDVADGSDGAIGGGAVAGGVGGATAVIIASHGRNEIEAIRAALEADVGFIGMVASTKRGEAVLAELAPSDDERKRIHSPVGIAIGARTAEEIALSILADLVRAIRLDGLVAAVADVDDERPHSATAIDPVCGMTVTIVADTPHLLRGGVDHWFCNPGCRTRFIEEPTR